MKRRIQVTNCSNTAMSCDPGTGTAGAAGGKRHSAVCCCCTEAVAYVLQAISDDPSRRQALIGWIRELTPMDAVGFEFPADQSGKVLVTLVEENGQRTSVHSASDGTLRFLAMIAALLGPHPARFCFFEELDNGIHPSRLDDRIRRWLEEASLLLPSQ